MTIAELTALNQSLETEKAELSQKLTAATEAQAALDREKTALQQLLDEASGHLTALGADKATLTQQLTDATAAKVKAETEFRQLRERDALNGGTLPAKEGQAGVVAGSQGSGELYDRFQKAGPIEARTLLLDPKTGPLIRAESARRMALPPAA